MKSLIEWLHTSYNIKQLLKIENKKRMNIKMNLDNNKKIISNLLANVSDYKRKRGRIVGSKDFDWHSKPRIGQGYDSIIKYRNAE